MDSGATAIQPENNRVIRSIGIIIEKIILVRSSSLARSKDLSGTLFMSNLFVMDDSYAPSRELTVLNVIDEFVPAEL